MDITQQPAIDEAPDISPIDIQQGNPSITDRLSQIESVLNITN